MRRADFLGINNEEFYSSDDTFIFIGDLGLGPRGAEELRSFWEQGLLGFGALAAYFCNRSKCQKLPPSLGSAEACCPLALLNASRVLVGADPAFGDRVPPVTGYFNLPQCAEPSIAQGGGSCAGNGEHAESLRATFVRP